MALDRHRRAPSRSTPRWARPREVSGGSAANTMVGVASFGGTAAFVGRVSDDQLGAVFGHDIRAAGVRVRRPPPAPSTACRPAAASIIVTPDAERTLNTFLGASAQLGPTDVDDELVGGAQVHVPRGLPVGPARGEGGVPPRGARRARGRAAASRSRSPTPSASTATAPSSSSSSSATSTSCSRTRPRSRSLYEVDDFDDALQRVHAPLRDRRAHPEREGLGDRGAATRSTWSTRTRSRQRRRHHRRRRPLRRRLPLRPHARVRPRHRGPARRARGGGGHHPPRRPAASVARASWRSRCSAS